jgi:predicted aspartyl protease
LKAFLLLACAALLLGWLLSTASVRSTGISKALENELQTRAIPSKQFGVKYTATGEPLVSFTVKLNREHVSVPMEDYRGLPAVDVSLNHGKPIRLILDTGAQTSLVEAKPVAEAKAHVLASEELEYTVTGAGGKEQAWVARFDNLGIGPMELKDVISLVRRSQSSIYFAGIPLFRLDLSLLGARFLSSFNHVTINYPAKRVVFSAATDFKPKRGARRVPLVVRDDLFYIPLRVGTNVVSAMVDTGSGEGIFLDRDLVKKWGMDKLAEVGKPYLRGVIGGETRGRKMALPHVFIGDKPVRDATIYTSKASDAARIGSGLLARWRVTFDFQRRVMWLE